MPTYEYKCYSCDAHFEAVQKITEEPLKSCPKCSSSDVKRQMSAPAFHLKGSGWYKTDYASGSSGGAGSVKGEAPKASAESSASSTSSNDSTATATPSAEPKPAASSTKKSED